MNKKFSSFVLNCMNLSVSPSDPECPKLDNPQMKHSTGFDVCSAGSHTGGRGGITQGVSFEFFESFLSIYSHNTH